jgi:hypothetical protein
MLNQRMFMPVNHSQKSFLITKTKNRSDGWIVESSGQHTMGPYFDPAVALQAAALELLSLRGRGLKANIFVSDNNNYPRLCQLIDKIDGLERCTACQRSWSAAVGSVAPRCPLREALGGWCI